MAKKEKNEAPSLKVVKNEETNTDKNKPTPEEVAQYKEDFDNAMKEFAETKFTVSDPGSFSTNETIIFLQDYLKKYALWSKTGWMGIIKMNEVLEEARKENNEKTGLMLDYQALEFCGYMLMNPGHIGLESAIEFEKIADKYSQIMMDVGKRVEEAREKLQRVQYLQEKWAAAEQGFYLADLEKTVNKDEVPKIEGNTTEMTVIDNDVE